MKLRDHNQPCEHQMQDLPEVWGDGYHVGHPYQYGPARSAWCPGGRLIEVDYEAAQRKAESYGYEAGKFETIPSRTAAVVDAALGKQSD